MTKRVFIHFSHGLDVSLISELTSKVKNDYKFNYKYSADHITEFDKDILSHGDAFALIAPDNRFKFSITDLDSETKEALFFALALNKDVLLFYKNMSTGYTLYKTSITYGEISGISGTSDDVRQGYFKGSKHLPAGLEHGYEGYVQTLKHTRRCVLSLDDTCTVQIVNTILLRSKHRK